MADIDAAPAKVNIKNLVIGDDFTRTIRLLAVNYSTWTFTSKVYLQNGTTQALTIGTVSFNDPDTVFTLTVPKTVSIMLTPGYAHAWDLQGAAPTNGPVQTFLRGKITALTQVTT